MHITPTAYIKAPPTRFGGTFRLTSTAYPIEGLTDSWNTNHSFMEQKALKLAPQHQVTIETENSIPTGDFVSSVTVKTTGGTPEAQRAFDKALYQLIQQRLEEGVFDLHLPINLPKKSKPLTPPHCAALLEYDPTPAVNTGSTLQKPWWQDLKQHLLNFFGG